MINLKVLAAAATLAAAPGLASAAVVLDDFSTDQTVADAPVGGFPTSNTVANRTFTVDNRAAIAPFDASLVSGGANDVLDFSNNTGVRGIATIDWVYAGLDLSTGGSFLIDLLTFDLSGTSAEIGLTVNGVTSARDFSQSDIGTLSFDFALFGGVDFANVTSISLFVDAIDAPALDVSFDDLRVAPVPVPAAGLMLLGGLGALGAAKRRKS